MKALNRTLIISIIAFAILLFSNCTSETILNEPEVINQPFSINNSQLNLNNEPISPRGVNALQTFGLNDAGLMNAWNIEISREFIGNLREQPIDGSPFQASDGNWYHPLQLIVNQNRANNRITILCPFGWVNESGEQTLFTGLNPSEQPFYNDYKIKMQQIAEQFKDQPDVWIEVWNEPFHWDNINYSHDLWLSDIADMIDNLRWVEGFQNIILVPGNEQGQSEDAIMAKGHDLLEERYNLLFDLHAYEKWLLNSDTTELVSRFNAIHNAGFAFIIGELGVQNVSEIMPVEHFLEAATQAEIPVLAWLWNQNSEDPNALLNDSAQPNSSVDNNFWGSLFQSFLID